jgi:hypothetical protein
MSEEQHPSFGGGWFNINPAEIVEQRKAAQMRGLDEANAIRAWVMEMDVEGLQVFSAILENVIGDKKMAPLYLGIVLAALDLNHGVSIVDGRTDEDRLRDAGIGGDNAD